MLALVVVLVVVPAVAAGALHVRSRQPISTEVLRLRFVRDGFGDNVLLVSGQYAYVGRGLNGTLVTGTLSDDRTGKRASIASPAGCYPQRMGGRWLLFSCQGGLEPVFAGEWSLATRLPSSRCECDERRGSCPRCGRIELDRIRHGSL